MQTITRNHTGHRCGASHQRAKLTTEQVNAMRAEYSAGGAGYAYLAAKYQCGVSTVRDIVQYRTRWVS
jgi:Mor family transcriptional regulator